MNYRVNAFFVDGLKDNVVVVTEDIKKDDMVSFLKNNETVSIKANADIPIYHKMSTEEIKKGQNVIKYGESMGVALEDIHVGDYVHVHNAASLLKTGN